MKNLLLGLSGFLLIVFERSFFDCVSFDIVNKLKNAVLRISDILTL